MAQSPHIGDSDLAKRKRHKNITKVHNKGSVCHKELARSFSLKYIFFLGPYKKCTIIDRIFSQHY
jgi:hypothetical protein